MENRAHARHCQVALHMSLCVPAKGAHAVAGLDAQFLKSRSKPGGPYADLRKACTLALATPKCNDFAGVMDNLAVLEDCVYREGVVLHGANQHLIIYLQSV